MRLSGVDGFDPVRPVSYMERETRMGLASFNRMRREVAEKAKAEAAKAKAEKAKAEAAKATK